MNCIVASGDIYLQENWVCESWRMSVTWWLKSLWSILAMKHLVHLIVVTHNLYNLPWIVSLMNARCAFHVINNWWVNLWFDKGSEWYSWIMWDFEYRTIWCGQMDGRGIWWWRSSTGIFIAVDRPHEMPCDVIDSCTVVLTISAWLSTQIISGCSTRGGQHAILLICWEIEINWRLLK